MTIVAFQDRTKNKILAILLVSVLMDYIGAGIVIPLLPFYAQSFGASPMEIGLLIGAYPLMGVFAVMLWGSLSDRIGRRPALLFNIAGTTLYFLWLSFSNSFWMLLIARILGGTCSASLVIAQSYVSDLTTTDNRTKMLSILGGVAGIGFVIGPAIGGILAGDNPTSPNFYLPNLIIAIASGLTCGLAFAILPRFTRKITTPTSQNIRSLKQFFSDIQKIFQRPLIGMFTTLEFIVVAAGMGVQAIFALWCEEQFNWGPQQFCYLIIFYCFVTAFIQLSVTGRLARWLGEPKLLVISLYAMVMGLFLIPVSTTVPQLLMAMLFSIFAEATFYPTRTSLLSQLSGAKQQGKTLGLMQAVTGLSRFLGATWAGFLFGTLGKNWPYWISLILVIMGTVFCAQKISHSRLSKLRSRRRRQKLMHLFNLLDHDQNGTIELQDFQQAGHNLASLRGWRPDTPEYDVLQASLVGFCEMLQQLADRDGNQKIDRKEWLHWLEQDVDYDFANLFLQMIDTNQDGQIAMEELSTFYQAYGIRTEELEEAFHTLDLNQDGHISKKEFETIFAQFLHSDDIQAPGNWIFGTSLPRQL
ncbi:MAG: MFS transporter [Cyanobacteria bacterium P01_F01_bin.150]